VVLCAIEIATEPLPVPDAPPVTEIQSAFDVAVHEQLGPAVTATDVDPPATAADALVGAIAYEQVGAGAACAIVKV
jgi:hypothetical protein